MELLAERDKSELIDGGQWMSLFTLLSAAAHTLSPRPADEKGSIFSLLRSAEQSHPDAYLDKKYFTITPAGSFPRKVDWAMTQTSVQNDQHDGTSRITI
jgi:hypothetical protein